MLDLLPSPGPDIVAFRVTGKVTAGDIERSWAAIGAALDEAATIGLYVEIADLGGFTLDALVKDVAMGFQQIGQWRRFARYAVVADAAWIRTMASIEGAILPGIEIRAYTPDQGDDAMAWLADRTAPIIDADDLP